MRVCSLLCLCAALSACGEEEPGSFVPEVEFAACSFDSDGDDGGAECARVSVPATWDEPEGEQLELFLKRRRGDAGSNGQLWLLAGGPGVDGAFFELIIDRFLSARDDLDIYILDHRGTGRSSRLECPAEEAVDSPGGATVTDGELDTCLDHLVSTRGDELATLNPTEAARDVAALIDAVDDGGEVFVYGRSYGTYLLHRYLQVAPDQATGVIFDSICGPHECRFPAFYDLGHDDAGRGVLAACAADVFCRNRLPAPDATLAALYGDLDSGHCSAFGWNRWGFRGLLSTMVRDVTVRQYVPAAIFRLARCSGADVDALHHLGGVVYSQPSPAPATERLRSLLLRSHIVYSELWQEPTSAEVQAIDAALFVGGAMATMPSARDGWPRYQPHRYVDELADTEVPVLMMHGGLDPQTPPWVAVSLRERLVGSHQHWVEVPLSPHGVINSSPIAATPSQTCGEVLLAGFVTDPTAPPDDGCADLAAPLDFDGDASESTQLFGRADPWDG